jgi:hypothetical protein
MIENDADFDVESGFWVELFVDPPSAPKINSIAGQHGHGAFWYVPDLGAHQTLSLAIEDADSRYSDFGGRFSPGRHEVYAYVDAYNTEGEIGLVLEVDETNNLLGPLLVEFGSDSDDNGSHSRASLPGEILSRLMEGLERFLAQLRDYIGSAHS